MHCVNLLHSAGRVYICYFYFAKFCIKVTGGFRSVWQRSFPSWWHIPLDFLLCSTASAIYAVVMCPSVRPSVSGRLPQAGIVLKWLVKVVFSMEASFHISHTVIRKFGYLQKLGHFPLGLGKFSHSKSIAFSTKLVIVDGRICWQHLYDSQWVVAVYYKLIKCNSLTPFLRFVVQLVFTVGKILTDIACRAVYLQLQSFLLYRAAGGCCCPFFLRHLIRLLYTIPSQDNIR